MLFQALKGLYWYVDWEQIKSEYSTIFGHATGNIFNLNMWITLLSAIFHWISLYDYICKKSNVR